jgi:ATP synthase protein I
MAADDKQSPENPWRMAHMGLELAGAALISGAIGWWLDQKFGWSPWGVLTGLLIGCCGGFYLFIKEALSANR